MSAATALYVAAAVLFLLAVGFSILGGILLAASRYMIIDDPTDDSTMDDLMDLHDAVQAREPVRGPVGAVHVPCFDRWHDRSIGQPADEPCAQCASILAREMSGGAA